MNARDGGGKGEEGGGGTGGGEKEKKNSIKKPQKDEKSQKSLGKKKIKKFKQPGETPRSEAGGGGALTLAEISALVSTAASDMAGACGAVSRGAAAARAGGQNNAKMALREPVGTHAAPPALL